MDDDSVDMEDDHEITVSIWEMTVSIWNMTVSIWDILSLYCQTLPVLKLRGLERPARRLPLLSPELVLADLGRINRC